MTTAKTSARARVPERFLMLDALRGFAAIGVALHHFSNALVPAGYLAVDFFFALSGFVLVHSYAHRLETGLTPWRFIRLRLVRLFPLHVVGIAVGMAMALQMLVRHRAGHLGVAEFLGAAALNPFLLPSPFGRQLFPLNPPAWSLFFELMANVAMVLVLVRLRLRGLLIVVAVAAVLLIATASVTPFTQDPLTPPISALISGVDWTGFATGCSRTLFSFSLGMALAHLPRAEKRVQQVWALPCCALLLAVLAFRVSAQARLPYDLAVVCLVSPLLIYGCSRFEPDRRFAPVAGFVGEMSFALYAINFPMAGLFHAVTKSAHLSDAALAPVFLGVCMALAWCAVRWFDIPARRYLGRLILR